MPMLSAATFQKFQAGFRNILNQGFCESCCLCDRSAHQEICSDCWRQVLDCQQFTPLPTTAINPPLLAWGRYQGGLKRVIACMKYQQHPAIAARLGEELGLRWLKCFPQMKAFQVVPIPLHRDRLIQRGYNQAELIARRFSQVIGVPCRTQGLIRTHQTQAQHGLDPARRKQNLKGAFAIGPNLKKHIQPVLLIDDIFTTGATTKEAQNLLRKAKLKVLGSAVVAQAPFEDN